MIALFPRNCALILSNATSSMFGVIVVKRMSHCNAQTIDVESMLHRSVELLSSSKNCPIRITRPNTRSRFTMIKIKIKQHGWWVRQPSHVSQQHSFNSEKNCIGKIFFLLDYRQKPKLKILKKNDWSLSNEWWWDGVG